MKREIIITILLFYIFTVYASINGKVTDKQGEPIPGVNIYWLNTSIGTVSDLSGEFSIPEKPGNKSIVFSNVAFKTDTIVLETHTHSLHVQLDELVELSELSVVSKVIGTTKSRTTVLQTEKISAAELCKAACCNLSESFETNPSVDVSYSDAATGAKQIKMLGLSGTYVQMLTENIPNLRGISTPYGLGYIPGPWMESIQVSKGTSSVINGYEAITGQINVEYKKPQSDEIVALNVFGNDAGRIESNLNASAELNHHLSTAVLLHASDELQKIDNNKDDFLDMPMVKQYNFINRWQYKRDKYVGQAFIRALSEERMGGQLVGPYRIGIETERYEFFVKNGYVFDAEGDKSIGLIISGSLHDQKADYTTKQYYGKQSNLYANFIYQNNISEMHKISLGSSFNYDKYDERLTLGQSTLYPRKDIVPGVFAEYTFNLNDKLILLGGLRMDYDADFGLFATPRLHVKYAMSEHLNVRASAGKGYRKPNVLSEYNYILASNRSLNIQPNLKMEDAWNYGVSAQSFIHLFEKELSITAEWYYTYFLNQTVVDMDTDVHAVTFSNLNGKSFSNSGQIEASVEVLKGLTFTLAHRINEVKTTINGTLRDKPLTNRSKSFFTTSYQTPLKKWQFDFTAQLNGGGRLPDAAIVNPLWENSFSSYTILNSQITKYFKTWSIYVGGENLTDFVQSNPIIDVNQPFGNDFDASLIWGPTHGRKLYVGFRWALNRKE